MNRETLVQAIEALKKGERPLIGVQDVPAFSSQSGAGNEHLSESSLNLIVSALSVDDIPTLERAIQAIDNAELAWIGFKVVYDSQLAVSNVDNEVTKKYGNVGSADGESLMFFCNDAKEIVSSREPSPRDIFQMKDVTRGPSMHNEQFDGLMWASVALFDKVKVWLLGASDVAVHLASLAKQANFDVIVVDNDETYLNEARFPGVTRILLDTPDFSALEELHASEDDYVCVLSRGHMYDPECCVWAEQCNAHYVGMMGCAGKNNTVYDLVSKAGLTDDQWDHVKRPIGLKFGAKTPFELAIAIVAELIDVRYRQQYGEQARIKHEISLGRE